MADLRRVKLEIIEGGANMRTDSVVGWFRDMPAQGKRFEMVADPIAVGALARVISTSPVKSVIPCDDYTVIDGYYTVITQNSKYKLTVLD